MGAGVKGSYTIEESPNLPKTRFRRYRQKMRKSSRMKQSIAGLSKPGFQDRPFNNQTLTFSRDSVTSNQYS